MLGVRKTRYDSHLRRSALAARLCGLAVATAFWPGCKGGGRETPPEALASPLAAGVQPELSDVEAHQVLTALESATGDAEPVDPPRTARFGRRWADVPAAAGRAADEIEGAVFRKVEFPDAYRFEIWMINGRPVELLVQRVDDERVYAATATVGRFDDDPETAQRLLDAFDEALLKLGKKKKFEE